MGEGKRYTIKTILSTTVWILLGAGTVVLLAAAINKKNGKHCKAVRINISGVQNNFFIDTKDVTKILESMNMTKMEGKQTSSINLARMESVLEKNEWIKKAELFFDNNEVLRVDIIEREPVARIFTTSGRTFYIDTSLTRLPLSDKFSARLPVFTNFPAENRVLSKEDSNLLTDVKNVSEFILNDPFWMAQIDQVNITEDRTFEMIPKIGNQVIIFGNAEKYGKKFNDLLTFYKQVLSRVGWNKYSKINVQYNGQIVAVKRDVADVIMDSLKAKELMKMLVVNAQRLSNDSANNIQLIQPKDDNNLQLMPLVNDEPLNEDVVVPPAVKSEIKTPVSIKRAISNIPSPDKPAIKITVANAKPVTAIKTPATNIVKPLSDGKPNLGPQKKPIVTKPVVKKTIKPKAVMPARNDY